MQQDQQQEADWLLPATATFSLEEEVAVDPAPFADQRPATPLWAWALLCAAVTAVSSAGAVFAKLVEVPPLTLAAWRLQLTSVFLGVGAVVQLSRMPPADRARTLQQAGLLVVSGTCLCFHFGAWVFSVEATSLTHSLLFVSATPLFLAAGAWLLRKPISAGELAGTAAGLAGGVLLATAAARSDAQVTVRGDLAALSASLAFVGYLLIGQRLRTWMPLFVYASCVTGLAALQLTLGSLLFEGATLTAAGKRGVFGWLADRHYLPRVLYLAVVPGIVGHTGFNTLLRYLDPLIISLACNMEPLIGSLLGWAVGVVTAPGAWTYAGGSLVMASTLVVSLASHRREQQAASRQKAAAQVHRILGGSGDSSDDGLAGEGDKPLMQPGRVAEEAIGFGGVQSRSARGEALQPSAEELAEDGGWGGLWLQLQDEDRDASRGVPELRLLPPPGF